MVLRCSSASRASQVGKGPPTLDPLRAGRIATYRCQRRHLWLRLTDAARRIGRWIDPDLNRQLRCDRRSFHESFRMLLFGRPSKPLPMSLLLIGGVASRSNCAERAGFAIRHERHDELFLQIELDSAHVFSESEREVIEHKTKGNLVLARLL